MGVAGDPLIRQHPCETAVSRPVILIPGGESSAGAGVRRHSLENQVAPNPVRSRYILGCGVSPEVEGKEKVSRCFS